MIQDKKIKFAIIGCGHIGKRHAEMILRNPESELIAICDPAEKKNLNIGNYNVPFFNSADELLNSDLEYDVVCICSPNGSHAEQAIKALEKRKHVLIEKPMALTKADCERIIFKALQVHKIVFCVMQNRYSPPSVWLKEIMNSNLLGKIFMVQLVCYWNRDERYYKSGDWKGTTNLDGGTLFTQFSHWIDLMYWLFGDISDIQAKFDDFTHQNNTAFEDSGFINFRFLNGGMGCINYTTSVYDVNQESSMTIIGENGSIKVGGQYMNEVEYCHIKDYKIPELPPVSPANDYGTYKGSAANHHFIIENVINTLKGRTSITTNALEGLKVVEIIERIYSLRKLNKKEIILK
ncbi:MAG: Gfo/Idh/MocA family protein [Bacteroidia bacterium]